MKDNPKYNKGQFLLFMPVVRRFASETPSPPTGRETDDILTHWNKSIHLSTQDESLAIFLQHGT